MSRIAPPWAARPVDVVDWPRLHGDLPAYADHAGSAAHYPEGLCPGRSCPI